MNTNGGWTVKIPNLLYEFKSNLGLLTESWWCSKCCIGGNSGGTEHFALHELNDFEEASNYFGE